MHGLDADAMNKLGNRYRDGISVEQNYREAVFWYLKAAEGGNVDAMRALALFFTLGVGVEQNLEQANYWTEMVINCQ